MDKRAINSDENLRGMPQAKKSMVLKREVLDMRLDGVFPEDYPEKFFERFPKLNQANNYAKLINVMNSRSSDQIIISHLRKWYNELKKEQQNEEEAA